MANHFSLVCYLLVNWVIMVFGLVTANYNIIKQKVSVLLCFVNQPTRTNDIGNVHALYQPLSIEYSAVSPVRKLDRGKRSTLNWYVDLSVDEMIFFLPIIQKKL